MAWSKLAPTMPPDVAAMLADQENRWNNNNYGAGFGEYTNWDTQQTPQKEFDWDSLIKGNMFFTENNIPEQSPLRTTNSIRPFIWNGNNKSLRDAYKATYDAYTKAYPNVVSQSYDTWNGPEIRALYGEEGSTPMYWQDNDMSGTLGYDIDDTFINKSPQTSTEVQQPLVDLVDTAGEQQKNASPLRRLQLLIQQLSRDSIENQQTIKENIGNASNPMFDIANLLSTESNPVQDYWDIIDS